MSDDVDELDELDPWRVAGLMSDDERAAAVAHNLRVFDELAARRATEPVP